MAAALVGMISTIVTDWVDDKKMDYKIDRKVNEALAERESKGES